MKKLLLIAFSICFFFAAKASDTTTVNVVLIAGENVKTDTLKVIDKVTGAEVNAFISNINIVNSNPQIASVTYLSRVMKVTRVGVGSGTATLTCQVSYTDPGDGLQKVEAKTIIINYSVIGSPHGVSLQVFN